MAFTITDYHKNKPSIIKKIINTKNHNDDSMPYTCSGTDKAEHNHYMHTINVQKVTLLNFIVS